MTTPRVVVMLGAYNEAEYLDETVPALLAQTMPHWRALLVDNGSTDDTWAILQRLTAHDPRVTLLRTTENLSPPVALNRGWALALEAYPDARWILAAGADDLMAPDYLAALLDAADANPTANCVFAPRQWLGHPERGVQPWPAYDPESVHAIPQIPAWRMVARELWQAVGPEDATIRIGSDWEWAVRASTLGLLRPHQIEQPLLSLRVRGARTSQSEEVDWPALHHRLCAVAGKPAPAWAVPRALC